jgi:hypothetical protein
LSIPILSELVASGMMTGVAGDPGAYDEVMEMEMKTNNSSNLRTLSDEDPLATFGASSGGRL